MDPAQLGIFQLMARKMGWLGARHSVLSENIANSDTPGYKPRDLQGFSFEELVRPRPALAVARTSSGHLSGTAGQPAAMTADGRAARPDRAESVYETQPSGNAVVLEEQMLKVAETSLDYGMVTQLYRKHMDMLRAAVGSPNR